MSGHECWLQPHIQPWNHGNAASNHAWSGSVAIQNQPVALDVVARGPECNWARDGLCQVCFGGISLITCQIEGCARQLHHMCQKMWESVDEAVHKAHGSKKLCAFHHPAMNHFSPKGERCLSHDRGYGLDPCLRNEY